MSPWAFMFVIALILWALHVQRLNEKRRTIGEELKELQLAQKNLKSTLISRGKRLDVLFSAVNEVVMRVDHLGRIITANTHARHVFHMENGPELPQSLLLFYRDPDWHRAFSLALKALPEASTLPDMHVDGRVLAPRLAPLGTEQVLLLCVDVSEKHRIEMQRKSLFANLMHDLKTPLTSILGYARSIEAFGDDVEIRNEAVKIIANESVRANEFLDALLTLEHVESFSPDVSARADLQEVLNRVLLGFSSQMEAKSVAIEWSGQNEVTGAVEVKMAESDLHRILDNLIENALRYAPENSYVHIDGSFAEKTYQLEITDQGAGVSEKELPRLTERFYRGDKARAKSSDVGHGLGLAIVKELMEKYGGSLHLHNHDLYGLSVRINVPV